MLVVRVEAGTMKLESWPQCAVCNAPVERVSSVAMAEGRGLVLTVECHGEVERSELTRRDMLEAQSVRLGTAFQRKPA